MTATTLSRMTFEEFERLPEVPGKQELLQGELIELPPAKQKHNEIAEHILFRLTSLLAEAHGRGQCGMLGKVHHEMGYRMPDDGWLCPDVSVTHAGQAIRDYYLGPPALIVEVISNEKTANHIDAKIDEYLHNGALEVWVVYPSRKHVWIYRSGTAEQRSGTFSSNLLADGTINLDEILQ